MLPALRPVYPGGSNVFASVGHQLLPLARGQLRARNNQRFKVAANCCLRPDEPDGRQFVVSSALLVLKTVDHLDEVIFHLGDDILWTCGLDEDR